MKRLYFSDKDTLPEVLEQANDFFINQKITITGYYDSLIRCLEIANKHRLYEYDFTNQIVVRIF